MPVEAPGSAWLTKLADIIVLGDNEGRSMRSRGGLKSVAGSARLVLELQLYLQAAKVSPSHTVC